MWLVAPQLLEEIQAICSGDRFLSASKEWAAEQKKEAAEAAPAAAARGLSVAGGVAHVAVTGLLTKRPSFLAWLMGGGTTYDQIAQGLHEAAADPSVKSIVLDVDSSGGEVDGLFALFDAITATANVKPISVTAHKAQSAAYGIAAVSGGKITATNTGSIFGSVGVAASYFADPHVVDIASTNAPNKRPNLLTEEGKAVVRAELDQIHDAFASAIATGRSAATGTKVTSKTVNENYGRGGSMLAAQALEAGLVDALPKKTKPKRAAESAQVPTLTEKKAMKFSEYLAAHPAEAKEALAEARGEERARCVEHIELAQRSGAYDLAAKAIKEGTSANSPTVVFDHQEAKHKADQIGGRQEATDDVAKKLAGVTGGAKRDMGDIVADAMGAPALGE